MSIPLTGWLGFKWTFAVLALLAVLSAGIYNAMFNRMEEPPGKAATAGRGVKEAPQNE